MLTFREMKDLEEDYLWMKKWLGNPEVRKWYGLDDFFNAPTLEEVKWKYKKRCLKQEEVFPYFILINQMPIGYIQYYPIKDYGEKKGAYGVDLFIGEDKERNKGWGTAALKEIVREIFCHTDAQRIILDPDRNNKRAIRCYEKSGFIQNRQVGEQIIMLMER